MPLLMKSSRLSTDVRMNVNEWKAKVTNFFTGNETNYICGHMKQMIITTMDAKWSKFVESYIKDDPPPQQTFLRILQVVDEQMWVNHPQIRRIRRWLQVEINPNDQCTTT